MAALIIKDQISNRNKSFLGILKSEARFLNAIKKISEAKNILPNSNDSIPTPGANFTHTGINANNADPRIIFASPDKFMNYCTLIF